MIDVAPDGGSVRWRADRCYAAYEAGTDAGGTTHIAAVDRAGVHAVTDVPGRGIVFSPLGDEVAYLTIAESSELRDARAQVMRQYAVRDRQSLVRPRRELARIDAEFTRVVVREIQSGRERAIDTGNLAVFGVQCGTKDGVLYLAGGIKGESERTDID